nr:DUF1553 domain-containing protein [Armatimonadota bacterium]
LLVNGKPVLENAAASVTGSWQPEGQRWEPQGVFPFTAGKNTIRIERNDAIPHFDKLLLVPVKAVGDKPGAPPIQSAAEIAAAHHLNLEALRRCAVALRPLADSPALQSWPLPESLTEDQFTAAADKLGATLGTDAALAPLRKAADDSKGPFSLPDHPELYYSAADMDAVTKSAATLKTAQMAVPKPPMAMAVDEGTIGDVRVHIRGSTENLGDEVPRHFLRILPGGESPVIAKGHSGRLELAQWLASPENPLPARVEVNRIWQGHFGEGIVATADNFGLMGERPTHPQLLDWLAADFMEHGWSIKRMHRMILLSSTYRMSSALDDKANEIDPANRLLWRANRRRLEAEPFRDAVLKVAGKLDLTMGGSLLNTADHDYVTNDQSNNAARYDTPRRSVYLPVIRNSVFDMFQAFDFGDPSLVNAHRASTTVAPQALYIMNSPFMVAQSQNFAAELLAGQAAGDPARIGTAYLRALGRPATPAETARALSFIERYSSRLTPIEPDLTKRRLRAWSAFCQAVLASNEFIYID